MEDIIRAIGLYDLVGYLLPGCVLVFSFLAYLNARWRSKGLRFHEPHPATFLIASYVVGFMLQSALSPTRNWSIFPLPLVGTTIDEVFKFPDRPSITDADAKIASRKEEFDRKMKKFSEERAAQYELIEALKKASVQAFNASADQRYYLAEAYVRARQLDSFPAIMQARHAFARGMVMSLFFSMFAFLFAAWLYFKRPQEDGAREWGGGDKPELFGGYLRIASPANGRPWVLCIVFAVLCGVGARIAYIRAQDFDRYQKEAIFRIFYTDYTTQRSANASPSSAIVSGPPSVSSTSGAPAK